MSLAAMLYINKIWNVINIWSIGEKICGAMWSALIVEITVKQQMFGFSGWSANTGLFLTRSSQCVWHWESEMASL